MTRRRSAEFDELHTNASYVRSIYKLLVAVIECVSDRKQLEQSISKAAKCDGRAVLRNAMQARLDALRLASTSSTIAVAQEPIQMPSDQVAALRICPLTSSTSSVLPDATQRPRVLQCNGARARRAASD